MTWPARNRTRSRWPIFPPICERMPCRWRNCFTIRGMPASMTGPTWMRFRVPCRNSGRYGRRCTICGTARRLSSLATACWPRRKNWAGRTWRRLSFRDRKRRRLRWGLRTTGPRNWRTGTTSSCRPCMTKSTSVVKNCRRCSPICGRRKKSARSRPPKQGVLTPHRNRTSQRLTRRRQTVRRSAATGSLSKNWTRPVSRR